MSLNSTILSLCDYSGVWSAPYRAAGYNVIQVDLAHGQDVRDFEYVGSVHGVLAAPPCTVFSIAGQWVKRSKDEWLNALSIADACIRIITVHRPTWWALENPKSSRVAKWLGPPSWTFQPWQYGDPWTKGTGIWGTATQPPPRGEVEPKLYGTKGKRDWTTNQSPGRGRSTTPKGFAQAFFEANP